MLVAWTGGNDPQYLALQGFSTAVSPQRATARPSRPPDLRCSHASKGERRDGRSPRRAREVDSRNAPVIVLDCPNVTAKLPRPTSNCGFARKVPNGKRNAAGPTRNGGLQVTLILRTSMRPGCHEADMARASGVRLSSWPHL